MSTAVHIVALGARTPVGLTAAASAAAVRAGISRLVLHPFIADRTNENVRGAIDGAYDPAILGARRIGMLAASALTEVVQALTLRSYWRPLPVFVSLPEQRPGFGRYEESYVLNVLQESCSMTSYPVAINQMGRGHAGGLEALANAAAQIQAGREDLCIIGGADSYFDFDTLDWLQENRQLSNRDTRGGFPPGEAAGFLALASEDTRRRFGLASLGVVCGWGIAKEKRLIKSDQGSLGQGLAEAITAATVPWRLPAQGADDMYCDINGERYRSEEWSLAVLRVPHAAKSMNYVAPVHCWGDVGAAIGPLSCILATRAWARRYAHGRHALLWGGSEAGLRAAVTLAAPEEN